MVHEKVWVSFLALPHDFQDDLGLSVFLISRYM